MYIGIGKDRRLTTSGRTLVVATKSGDLSEPNREEILTGLLNTIQAREGRLSMVQFAGKEWNLLPASPSGFDVFAVRPSVDGPDYGHGPYAAPVVVLFFNGDPIAVRRGDGPVRGVDTTIEGDRALDALVPAARVHLLKQVPAVLA